MIYTSTFSISCPSWSFNYWLKYFVHLFRVLFVFTCLHFSCEQLICTRRGFTGTVFQVCEKNGVSFSEKVQKEGWRKNHIGRSLFECKNITYATWMIPVIFLHDINNWLICLVRPVVVTWVPSHQESYYTKVNLVMFIFP